MAVIESSVTPISHQQFIEENSAARVAVVKRGNKYGLSATTGTIAAALAINSCVFGMRLDSGSPNNAFIERLRLYFTTIAAFTVPIVAGRRLELYRGSSLNNFAGGTNIPVAVRKKMTQPISEFDLANTGDLRISTTAGLTVTGITFETTPFRTMHLTHVGNAGNYLDCLWEFADSESSPIQLEPGQVLGIRNPAAMDAGGTWQLGVNVDWFEAAAI